MTASQLIQQDPLYLSGRLKQYKSEREWFAKRLAHILSIMPCPKIVLDLKTGEGSRTIDPEWQSLIDMVVKEAEDHFDINFPEFKTNSK